MTYFVRQSNVRRDLFSIYGLTPLPPISEIRGGCSRSGIPPKSARDQAGAVSVVLPVGVSCGVSWGSWDAWGLNRDVWGGLGALLRTLGAALGAAVAVAAVWWGSGGPKWLWQLFGEL